MNKGRIESLDGLRAIAACLIVIYHLGIANFAASLTAHGHAPLGNLLGHFGASGVELFFTLSAVVLLRPYLRQGRPMDVPTYAWRRVTRLWPPFLGAWLLAGLTVLVVTLHPTWWPSALPQFDLIEWGSQAFIAYTGRAPYNFAWWTLTLEIAFYALAPLAVFILRNRSAWAFFGLMLLASMVAQWRGESRFLVYASCFAGGLVLAKQEIGIVARRWLDVAGIALVFLSSFRPSLNVHAGYGLLYMAIVSQAMTTGTRFAAWLSQPRMIWLGERSYSLFLTHYSVIGLACWSTSLVVGGKTAAFFLVSRLLAIVGSLAVACVLFEVVERRFARGLVTAGQWWPRQIADGL